MTDLNDIQHEIQSVLGYYELEMWDEALSEIAETEKRVGTRAELNELRLVVLQGAKRWEAMRKLAQQSAQKEPRRASWFISWAFALRREESIPSAKKVLEKALPLHPLEPLIPFNLACYAAQLGNLQEAKRYLSQAISLDPTLRETARQDSDLIPIRDQIDGGTLLPSSSPTRLSAPAALRVFARNLIEGDSTSRAVALHALVEARAESVFVSLLGSDQPAVVQLASRGLWECWLNEAGAPARVTIEKGMAAMERAEFPVAEKLFQRLMQQFPKWAEAINKMATLYYLEKRYAESLELCLRVVTLKPDHFGAWQGMALCAVHLEKWVVALEAARHTLRLQPQYPTHAEMVRTLEIKVSDPGLSPEI